VLKPLERLCSTQLHVPAVAGQTVTRVGDGTLILLGGRRDDEEFHNTMHRFSPKSSTWEVLLPAAAKHSYTEVFGHSAVYYPPGDAILVYGGMRPYHSRYADAFDTLHLFHVKTEKWQEVRLH
jgi:hypothetical protein